MKKFFPALAVLPFFFASGESHGFGKKKFNFADLGGVTETQVAKDHDRAYIFVRGKAAELMYRMIRADQKQEKEAGALKWANAKDATLWTVKGKQVACSKVTSEKKKKTDFACAFDLEADGKVVATETGFNSDVFNLARTETGVRLFNNKPAEKGSRALASVATAPATYAQGKAYVMYGNSDKVRDSEDAMIVFRGKAAREIMEHIGASKEAKALTFGAGVKGVKGREIACVESNGQEQDRCALVVSLRDGSVSRKANPLFP